MELILTEIKTLSDKEKNDIDSFIMNRNTNGEFINSLNYLSYHGERFMEDSVVVRDRGSHVVKGVCLAAVSADDSSVVISHPGTTFAGPVYNLRDSYQTISQTVKMMLSYYEERYREIYIHTTPNFYSKQEIGLLDYLLLRNGYRYGMTALSNMIRIENIESEEQLLGIYEAKRRNQVRKTLKSNEFVFKKVDRIAPDIWKRMNDNLYDRHSVHSTHTYEEIDSLQRKMPEFIIPCEVRHISGEYAAFGLVYKFKNVFHTQYLDMNYKYAAECPNIFLIHHLLLEACRERFPVFNFGTTTERAGEYLNEGLWAFKSGYGGGSIILPAYSKEIRGK